MRTAPVQVVVRVVLEVPVALVEKEQSLARSGLRATVGRVVTAVTAVR